MGATDTAFCDRISCVARFAQCVAIVKLRDKFRAPMTDVTSPRVTVGRVE